MIAVITSTIKPSAYHDSSRSFYSFTERLEQTKTTLVQLKECGFEKVFLVDNSPLLNQSELQQLLLDFPDVQIYHLQQYQFENKGVNEILMLLFIAAHLPAGQNIFKISGRYYPSSLFKKPAFKDFAFKQYNYKKRTGTISTRGYWVKDAQLLETFLLSTLNEVFAYPERIHGIKSFYKKFEQIFFNKAAVPYNISIEFAGANVLKRGNYHISFLNHIGIEGLVAGADHVEKIIE